MPNCSAPTASWNAWKKMLECAVICRECWKACRGECWWLTPRRRLRSSILSARRLLQFDPQYSNNNGMHLPLPLVQTLRDLPGNKAISEQEHSIAGVSGNRVIGISRANVSESEGTAAGTILILRDMTEQKRIAGEREAARR